MAKKNEGKVDATAKAATNGAAVPALNGSGAPPEAEIAAKIAGLRSYVRESFGKVVMAMMMQPRYRSQTLADLQHLVLEPLVRDRVAIAQRADDSPTGHDVAGVAVWASVTEEVDARIREQIATGTFPIRLKPEDWNSGNINWLLDVIAPDQKSTASVIANFRQLVKEGSLRLHPLITRLVDEETLKKMGAHKASEGKREEEPVA